jgi:hypothetical protein
MWGAQQWCRITKESAFGVFDSGAAPASIVWVRLVGNNPFTLRAQPQRQIIRSADSGNRRVISVANRKVIAGNMNTIFYPTQAAFFLDAALTLTSTPSDLHSYTLDYWDTIRGHRFLGAKIESLTAAGTATGDYLPLTMTWRAQSRDVVTLAQPTINVFPTENPYQHVESKGHVTIGTVQSKYSSFSVAVKNVLDGTWDEDQWISALYYCGRDIDMSMHLQYLSPTMRDEFNSQAPLVVTAAWARAGGLTTTFDLKTQNYISDVGDDVPLNAAAYQTIGIQTFFDGVSGALTDASFTVA